MQTLAWLNNCRQVWSRLDTPDRANDALDEVVAIQSGHLTSLRSGCDSLYTLDALFRFGYEMYMREGGTWS